MTNIYAKDVSNIKTLDPYRLQELYQMHPCAEHVVKKLLVAGEREGGKDLDTDISDCIRTLKRWQAMRAEDAASTGAPIRYHWDGKPSQLEWAATDADGSVYFYVEKPHIASVNSTGWTGNGTMGVPTAGRCADWRESLEARPK